MAMDIVYTYFTVGIESHVSIMAPKPKVESVKGGVAQLYVEAMGYPDPRVTWSKVGRDINYYGRISSVANHNQTGIRIVAVTGDDAGNYTATAISGQDRAQVNVTLIVNGEDFLGNGWEMQTSVLVQAVWRETLGDFLSHSGQTGGG